MNNLEFAINQKFVSIPQNAQELEFTLLHYLRETGFTGCKEVCKQGGCGACTVILSHWDQATTKVLHVSVTACLVPVATLHQHHITTIEGMTRLNRGQIHPICDAFYNLAASQCGFCTPGFIMSLVAGLANKPRLVINELEQLFDGNLCRCTGYRPILDAASVFCVDPLDKSEYSHDVEKWQKQFKQCLSLSDIFPQEFKVKSKTFSIQSKQSRWTLATGIRSNNLKRSTEAKGVTIQYIGGNTDLGCNRNGHQETITEKIVLNRISAMTKIEWSKEGLKIGAAVTIAQLNKALEKRLVNKPPQSSSLSALLNQCRYFGNNQIRNMATVGGGLMNFSDYSDMLPLWVATHAELELISAGKENRVKLFELYDYDGKMNFEPDTKDILLSIFVPYSQPKELISSYKYSRRRLDSITFLSAAIYARVNQTDSKVDDLIICYAGLGHTGFRAVKTEQLLVLNEWNDALLQKALVELKSELILSINNGLPKRLQRYQIRLAQGALQRFYASYKLRIFGQLNPQQARLISRYPKVAHRANAEYNEPKLGVLGSAIPHQNAQSQVTGKAKYTADQNIPCCLFGVLFRSDTAYGKIKSIDPSQALKHPDVVGFFTAKDIPGKNTFGFRVEDEEVLAKEQVGYVGQAIGILVAKSEAIARERVAMIKLEIEAETPLLSMASAIESKSFHGNPKGYLLQQGNLDMGFSNSDVVILGEVTTPPQSHFYLESQTAVVSPKDDGYEVYSSTQSPSHVVDHVSRILNTSKNKISVKVGRIGGGFGGKQLRAGPIAGICALACYHLDQPVKLALERAEDMAYCPGRSATFAIYKAGFNRAGKIKALDIQFYLAGGYSNDYSADITETATLLMDSCYKIPNVKVHGLCLKTNFGSNTAARGFGKPQASAIIETVLDHGATKLQLDPTELRQSNLYRKGDRTITKTKIDDNVVWQCWDRLLHKSKYQRLKKQVEKFNQNNRWLKRGVAAVCSKGNMGFIETDDINRGLAVVQILRDGSVSVNHSGCEMGQGINTRMAQVTAFHLSVELNTIQISDTQTAIIPNTPPTTMVATDLIGRAIIIACEKLNQKLNQFSGGFLEKVQQAYIEGTSLTSTGSYTAPRLQYDYEKQEGDISYFFVWGAALSIVELDIISGNFRLLKSNIIQDCGKSLNPLLDVGQAEGGFIFGVGLYTMEELIYDAEGQLITDNVSGYKIPTCGDVPLDWDIELLNYQPTGEGLHNSKGIGESNTQLGSSVYFAIKAAIRASRKDVGLPEYCPMNFPASVDRVCEVLPSIEDLAKE